MLIRRLGWMAGGAVALVMFALAFRARQVDLGSVSRVEPSPQSLSAVRTDHDANGPRASPEAGGPVPGSPTAPESSRPSRTAVTAHWEELEIEGVRLPKPDLSEPYPFAPGRAAALDVAGTLEVLERFYGAGLPAGWSVKALDLPGDGRFEVRVDAQGTPITLRGRLEAEDGYAHLTLEGEPEKKLTVPLPPGIESIKLTRGAARINRR